MSPWLEVAVDWISDDKSSNFGGESLDYGGDELLDLWRDALFGEIYYVFKGGSKKYITSVY